MKALILNSGLGSRMDNLTATYPKCMTKLLNDETILSRQLKMLRSVGINEIIITTGAFAAVLEDYVKSLGKYENCQFIYNPEYETTNYIFSIYLARQYLDDDILLIHGDVVFEYSVLIKMLEFTRSCVAISSSRKLPKKDFKAVVCGDIVEKIGIEFFENAFSAQPIYKLKREDWIKWLNQIRIFCERGDKKCYAEAALNVISSQGFLHSCDMLEMFCNEIDTEKDLKIVLEKLRKLNNRTVYMCFSTDVVHSGHIAIIKKASMLGKLIIGILSDEAVANFKRYPLIPFEERKALFENINGVFEVMKQDTLSYSALLENLKPDFVVHGDDWKIGFQKSIRDEVIDILQLYGGKLIEFPYAKDEKYEKLEKRVRAELSLPDVRRGRLKKIVALKGCINAIEAHSGLTGLIAEKTIIQKNGEAHQFDAIWVSSLCDSTAKGKPDIELVDMTSRFRTIDDIMEVTTKPIIFDGDTGGLAEHFVYTVKTLERMGVSAIIIEDKTGLKKNSLFGNEVVQTQDSIENFSEKIAAGKRAQKTQDFMIIARIESLILEKGIEDALKRAFAFVEAGADGIMIHSRRKEPTEIFEFVKLFREIDSTTPITVVPTSFNSVTEEKFKVRGINIVIYANQLTRSAFPAMQKVAETILLNRRAEEADRMCMPFKEIIRLIPEED